MKRSDFYYDLPEELIARYPLEDRTASRMLCLDGGNGRVRHRQFTDLLEELDPNDLVVFNNTRVIPARLWAHKPTGGQVEILIERVLGEDQCLAHLRASKTPKPGSELLLTQSRGGESTNASLRVEEREGDLFHLAAQGNQSLMELLETLGHMPLPPYLQRDDEDLDRERYQTVYGKCEGAVAAPTAGLHFSDTFMHRLKEIGIDIGFITLHVGAGTFQPVRADDVEDHKMHAEWLEVDAQLCQQVAAAQRRGGRVVAVGTTVVRALETAATSGSLQPFTGDSDIFIYPGCEFRVIDALVTNFHLPESTLIMLIAAFAGREAVLAAYESAVDQKYRFFSYGDAMFVTAPRAN
ncbi:MAG: tRNA preQ1(34) S-adenosylmethionine ribosyltransferase-isomerase QueA [Pseudomonadota bacterium]